MGEEKYVLSTMKDDEQRGFLRRQESVIDAVTIRHFETIGVHKGWKCLEVGAGAGSIAQWLASRVGPDGKVTATDINVEFLSQIRAPNLEARKHDILKDDLEKDEYDLVHSRKVLHHLPEPERALEKMADAIRPGGWLLIEEDDYGSLLSADVTDPSLTFMVTAARELYDSLRRKGIADYYFGRRVRGLVEGLGFVNVGQEGWTQITRGGEPLALLSLASMPALIAAGVLTQEQADKNGPLLKDPSLYYPNYTLFSAWGRKPAL